MVNKNTDYNLHCQGLRMCLPCLWVVLEETDGGELKMFLKRKFYGREMLFPHCLE